MTQNSAQDHKQSTPKNVRLGDELERLQSRIEGTRVFHDADDNTAKRRVVEARRTKLSFAW